MFLCTSDGCSSDSGEVKAPGGLDAGPTPTGSGPIDAGGEGGASDAGAGADGSTAAPASCSASGDGLSNCGSGAESCCASLLVPGGTFSRSYDGITSTFLDPQYKATIGDFRLDKYEVTVGRFRRFVDATLGGYAPSPGTGKHAHVNSGSGLLASGGAHEPGWDAAWRGYVPRTILEWRPLACSQTVATWTASPATGEKRPINCVTWYEAAAFCIWDGGFLPSEAEWNFAATGGSEQRAYPWSSAFPPGSAAIADADAVYCPSGGACSPLDVGSKSPAGDGRFGQADLSGNVAEWVLDAVNVPYATASCVNCTYVTSPTLRVTRGGAFPSDTFYLLASARPALAPLQRAMTLGIRCARAL